MTVLEIPRTVQVLCYEHHSPMKHLRLGPSQSRRLGPLFAYACPSPGCLIHYNGVGGYFKFQPGVGIRWDIEPWISCPNDDLPMYLAEVSPATRNYHLWRCQKCRSTRQAG